LVGGIDQHLVTAAEGRLHGIARHIDDRETVSLRPRQSRQPALIEAKTGVRAFAFGDRAETCRGIDIQHRNFDETVTQCRRGTAKDLLVDTAEPGEQEPVRIVQFKQRSALNELLDVGGIAPQQPRDLPISKAALTGSNDPAPL
jgi:hypothetical protein